GTWPGCGRCSRAECRRPKFDTTPLAIVAATRERGDQGFRPQDPGRNGRSRPVTGGRGNGWRKRPISQWGRKTPPAGSAASFHFRRGNDVRRHVAPTLAPTVIEARLTPARDIPEAPSADRMPPPPPVARTAIRRRRTAPPRCHRPHQ